MVAPQANSAHPYPMSLPTLPSVNVSSAHFRKIRLHRIKMKGTLAEANLPGCRHAVKCFPLYQSFLDAIENLALIALLLNSARMWLPALARWCAIVKFSIVGAGLIFIFGGLLVIGLKKIFKER